MINLYRIIYSLITTFRGIYRSAANDDHGMLASFGRRSLAYIFDYFLLFFFTMFLVEIAVGIYYESGSFIGPIEVLMQRNSISWNESWVILKTALVLGISSILQFVIRPFYYIFLEGTRGRTIGKQLFGCYVVSEIDNSMITIKIANKRYWSSLLSHITLLTGFLVVITQAKNQTLHDKICKTVVLRV